MESSAERRIKGRLPEKRPGNGREAELGNGRRPAFPLVVVLSAAIHIAVIGTLVYLPKLLGDRHPKADVYSITMTSMPGPMGGGGTSPEAVKRPADKETEKKQPEKDAVSLPNKDREKPQKDTDKPVSKENREAPKGPGQGPVGGGKPGAMVGPISVEGGIPFPFEWYIRALQGKVEKNWDNPVTWANRKPRVVVFFRIDRSGRISDVEIKEPSGIELYDQKAAIAVRKSSPLPQLPAEYKGDKLGIYYSFVSEGK